MIQATLLHINNKIKEACTLIQVFNIYIYIFAGTWSGGRERVVRMSESPALERTNRL